ncbi:MAG: ribosome-associated translation inhibitor RaiA [Winkia neuii]|uniref:Ribosome hibernation promoting factor n=1 Tax=Winkia neuii TaxID=33007 RepID=A0A2I1IPF4_9ACTO|nr:ribosome-associated translation inhibitor RaiA [Winkia neuii]OFJ71678.1 30S ribosomal protein S30 [Actinomyces sp. HMSC064C12]OFK01287.1 30S ribosomal protein S30 [Actinomyces sp. HMSC072A03]OFT55932.1 30S ribosomal protein S30 [Actinomyces sp. HMSC06A08]MDK8098915.1 ribosome-associated translation inhibitor RaiA [Winkia neuii]MDU3134550.1 ribosome-associated translation inhibitor RaiA [Winkia neuii]
MDIIVNARNAEIHPNFREYVEEKVSKVSQFYPRAQRVNVELNHERNPRQADIAERIELTVHGKGPVIRAEASSSDRYAAVDIAAGKLYERLRRARDRAKDHRRGVNPHEAEKPLDIEALKFELNVADAPEAIDKNAKPASELKPGEEREDQLGDSPIIVRQKVHEPDRMTVSEALYQMELVGHPFYLFVDSETEQPCVVYRRHGWTYGVLRLNARVEH